VSVTDALADESIAEYRHILADIGRIAITS
jgi:hypothetical protein